MATQISTRGSQCTIGQEEYSLYSSLSEDELVQMAIEQSLADKTRGPTTAEATASACTNRQPAHFYPWTRPADPLIKAIKDGDEEALKTMIKEGKNLAEPNKEGWLPLHEAAYYGQVGCLKVL
ncbi:ankyrin repeat and SOCS box containing 2, partial [Homo sapiens]